MRQPQLRLAPKARILIEAEQSQAKLEQLLALDWNNFLTKNGVDVL